VSRLAAGRRRVAGDGQAPGSLLVAKARRDELALVGHGAQCDEGCGAGHVALELAPGKTTALKILFISHSSQAVKKKKKKKKKSFFKKGF